MSYTPSVFVFELLLPVAGEGMALGRTRVTASTETAASVHFSKAQQSACFSEPTDTELFSSKHQFGSGSISRHLDSSIRV